MRIKWPTLIAGLIMLIIAILALTIIAHATPGHPPGPPPNPQLYMIWGYDAASGQWTPTGVYGWQDAQVEYTEAARSYDMVILTVWIDATMIGSPIRQTPQRE